MLLLCISHSGGEYITYLGPGGRVPLCERIFSMEALWVAGLKLRRPTKHVLWEQTFKKSQFSKFWKKVQN